MFTWDFVEKSACPNDLCMSMIFDCDGDDDDNDGIMTTLFLDRSGNSECAFQGYFEGYENKMVAVTTRDCPVSDRSSFLMTFWVPDICPNNMFFSAYHNGIGVAYQHNNHNLSVSVDSKNPPVSFAEDLQKRTRDATQASSFSLTDEFKVKLRIFYDDNFNTEFGATSTDR